MSHLPEIRARNPCLIANIISVCTNTRKVFLEQRPRADLTFELPAERSNRRDFPDTKEEFEVDGPKGVGGSKHHHH